MKGLTPFLYAAGTFYLGFGAAIGMRPDSFWTGILFLITGMLYCLCAGANKNYIVGEGWGRMTGAEAPRRREGKMERTYSKRQLQSVVNGNYMPRERALAQQLLDENVKSEARIAELEAENERLREELAEVQKRAVDLEKYATHLNNCGSVTSKTWRECDCGWREAMEGK